ncbi:hypothetical protein DSECCO2_500760 [anaerobic digester metagenome]
MFQQNGSNCCQQENGRSEKSSGKGGQDPDIDRSMYVHVQQNKRTESMDSRTPGDSRGACVFRTAANDLEDASNSAGNLDSGSNTDALIGSTCCQRAATVLPALPPINPTEYIPPPRPQKTSPGLHLQPAGRRRGCCGAGGGVYLCYDCLKKAKRPAKV